MYLYLHYILNNIHYVYIQIYIYTKYSVSCLDYVTFALLVLRKHSIHKHWFGVMYSM